MRDESMDNNYPVKDAGDDIFLSKIAINRQTIAKLSREEIEDRYLKLYDESIILKKHVRKQEEKCRKMATKLLRLVADEKKLATGNMGPREIELSDTVRDLQSTVRKLEKNISAQNSKLMVCKQQLVTQGQRPSAYTGIQSRIDTGRNPVKDPRIRKNMRVVGTPRVFRPDVLPRYGHSLLEEARYENVKMHDIIGNLQEQIKLQEQENEMFRNQVRVSEAAKEELWLKQTEEKTVTQMASIGENVEILRLTREIKERTAKLSAMELQYDQLQNNLKVLKASHDEILLELERCNNHVDEEQRKSLALDNKLKQLNNEQRGVYEMQHQIQDLENEKSLLKLENDKLLRKTFSQTDLDPSAERGTERHLRIQIAQLEAAIKGDLADKSDLLSKLEHDRLMLDQLKEEHRKLQAEHSIVAEKYDDAKDKLRIFTKDSGIDYTELEEALLLIKRRKERLEREGSIDELDALNRLNDLEVELSETSAELEKTRNMLIVQHNINKDYQVEVDMAAKRLADYKTEFESKIEEYASLLDMRAARIKKLEKQLRDVAYGTKSYKPDVEDDRAEDEDVVLERGQNMLEIHLTKAMLSQEAQKATGNNEPNTFCTFEFFEFELQVCGAIGSRDHVRAPFQPPLSPRRLSFKKLFDQPQGRVYNTISILSSDDDVTVIGTIEYWVKLKLPWEQSLRLFKEKCKAQDYVTANTRTDDQSLDILRSGQHAAIDQGINELHVKIVRALRLHPRRNDVQPSPYVVYKFYDFADHDSTTIANSNNPEFHDHQVYPVPINGKMDVFLKTERLELFVFDDNDPDMESYIGKAQIPLIPLAHDKPIKGNFELRDAEGNGKGTIDIEIYWQFAYLAPNPDRKGLKESPKRAPIVMSPRGDHPQKVRRVASDSPQPPIAVAMTESVVEATTRDEEPVAGESASDSGDSVHSLREDKLETLSAGGSRLVTVSEIYDDEEEVVSSRIEDGQILDEAPPERVPDSDDETETETETGEVKPPTTDRSHITVVSQPSSMTSDEDVVSKPLLASVTTTDVVKIAINFVQLRPDSSVYDDSSVSNLYVEYKFLGIAGEETETPYSLPKPTQPDQKCHFNFIKTFHVDSTHNALSRNFLGSMLLPDDPSKGNITFVIVSEPVGDNDGLECSDVGMATVNVIDLLKESRDLKDEELDIISPDGDEIIGAISVTINIVDALREVYKDIKDNKLGLETIVQKPYRS